MSNNTSKTNLKSILPTLRKEFLVENKNKTHRLAIACAVMLLWLLIWALVLKLGSESLLIGNYTNLKNMTVKERIMWDLIPFNYHGDDYNKSNQIMDTLLNCVVFVPFAVSLCYIFEKKNILRDAIICLLLSVLIETMQLITVFGNPATEDLITNTFGCFIGYAIYCLVLKRLSARKSAMLLALSCTIISLCVVFSLVTTVMASDVIFKILTKSL